MIFPDAAIRKAVHAALTADRIMLSGKEIKVFDSLAPSGTATPFIVLDGQQNLPDHTKDNYGFRHVFTLRIVSAGKGAVTGRDAAEKVLALMTPRLTPVKPGDSIPFQVTGWTLWKTALEGRDMPKLSASDGSNIYQKVLTLTLNVY